MSSRLYGFEDFLIFPLPFRGESRVRGNQRRGIEMSFEDTVNRIQSKLKGIVHKLNGHFTFFDDEDLYQESLIHLWIAWEEKTLEGKTDSYILQGCFFYLKNYIRTALDKVSLVSIDACLADSGATLEDMLSLEDKNRPLDSLESGLLMERFRKAGLTERESRIIDLTLDGLTTREIGRRLGVSHVRIIKVKKLIRIKCACLKEALPKV